jgi:hypothetical protein
MAALHEVHVHTFELVIELDEPEHWRIAGLIRKRNIQTRKKAKEEEMKL